MGIPLLASAGDFDGSKTLLCASVEASECVAGTGCTKVAPEAIDAPQFFKVIPDKKLMTSVRSDGKKRDTPVERSEVLDGKWILQGADDGYEDIRDGLGWSMAISQETGKMVLSASADGAAFVIFGACTPL
jgi:hypothetical protein